MAIEFDVKEEKCLDCGTQLVCVSCEYDGAALLAITAGERDVMMQLLEYAKQQQLDGNVRMSATDCVDLDTLLQKVRDLK